MAPWSARWWAVFSVTPSVPAYGYDNYFGYYGYGAPAVTVMPGIEFRGSGRYGRWR